MTPQPRQPQQRLSSAEYWRKSRNASLLLATLWASAIFGMIFFASDLQDIEVFGWSLPFYALAQGLLIFCVLLNAFYARYLRYLNRLAARS
ncbi:MAG: DUF4212 domain-containing protein [Burkholderiales bacterium]|nr:DUF4212 domain-containing protein [Burkholderiales bacterium]